MADSLSAAGTFGAIVRWLDEPSWKRAAVFGVAFGFGALCKFSCIAFVGVACLVLLLVRRRNPLQLLIAPATAFATIAAGYAFRLAPFFNGIRGIVALDREGFLSYAEQRESGPGDRRRVVRREGRVAEDHRLRREEGERDQRLRLVENAAREERGDDDQRGDEKAVLHGTWYSRIPFPTISYG
jgi:hypothetical protein